MSSVLEMMREGGAWMWVVVLFGVPGLVAPLLLAGLAAGKVRVPAVLWWLFPGACLLPGAVGTWSGLRMGWSVIPMVDPTQRGVIAHAALSEGVTPLMMAAGLAGPALAFAAVLSGVLSLTGDDTARRAELRVAAAGALPLGFGALALAWQLQATREVHRVLSHAAPEMRAALVAAAEGPGPMVALAVVVFAAFVAIGILMPVLGSLGTTRILVSAGLGLVALVALAVPAGLGFSAARSLAESMPETREPLLRERVPGLPPAQDLEGDDAFVDSFSLPVAVASGPDWIDVISGLPFEPPYTLAFGATEPLSRLAQLPTGSYALLVDQGRSLGGLAFATEAADPDIEVDSRFPNSLFVIEQASGAQLACWSCPSVSVGSLPELPTRFEKLLGPMASTDELVVVPGSTWTVRNFVSLCLSARDARGGSLRCTVMSQAPSLSAPVAAPEGEGEVLGGDPIILGALDRSLIEAVIARNKAQIRYCYERELHRDESIRGKVVVKFVIAKDGSVSSASIKSSTIESANLESCLVSRFQRFMFPEPKGGGIVIVSYPLNFQ